MAREYRKNKGSLVSVLIPTYNRPRYLSEALSSAVNQDYENLEIFVIRDGGQEVADVVGSFDDPRIIFINRKENRGLPFTLNEALKKSQGKYICYLGDDDIYYPHHVSTLIEVLENQTDCQVAYSDLYKSYCRVMRDGSRQVLSKVVEVSRDFDRFLMFFFNHALHVSIMHSRDLLEKAGLYNEDLNVLIDWDLTRRLVFFSDFHHVPEITGEFYHPCGESDRISVQRRKNEAEFARNVMAIRTTRPPKPWTKVGDLSIIFTAEQMNQQAGETLGLIWRHTFYPYQVYLPLPRTELAKVQTEMPNIIQIPTESLSVAEKVDMALSRCEGEYIVVMPSGLPLRDMWVEDSLHALINSKFEHEAFELETSTNECWAVLLRKQDLLIARKRFSNLPLRRSLEAAGILIRRLRPDEIPFQFDTLLDQARSAERNGSWAKAAEIFEYVAENYGNEFWMKSRAAKAFFKAGSYKEAGRLSREVNQERPTIDTLLLEAKVFRRQKNFNRAIELFERAEQILEGKELVWT